MVREKRIKRVAGRAVLLLVVASVVLLTGCGVRIQGLEDMTWPDSDFDGVTLTGLRAEVSGDNVFIRGRLEYSGPDEFLRDIRLMVTLEDKDENVGAVSEMTPVFEPFIKPGQVVAIEVPLRKPSAGTWYVHWNIQARVRR